MRDDQTGVDVGAVAEQGHAVAVPGQAGVPPCPRIRGVAGHRPGRRHYEAGVRVDDDLHVCREPVVTGGGTHAAVPDRDEGAVHDPHAESKDAAEDGAESKDAAEDGAESKDAADDRAESKGNAYSLMGFVEDGLRITVIVNNNNNNGGGNNNNNNNVNSRANNNNN